MKYEPSKEAKERVAIKKATHDAKKSIKGFCTNPYCIYCNQQKTTMIIK